MKKIFTRLAHIGITEEIPDIEKRYIILVNVIAVFMTFTICTYIPLARIYLPDNTLLLYTLTAHGLFFLLMPLLNHFHKYLASRLLFGISSVIFMSLESLLMGPEALTHYFLLFSPIIPFFLYPERERTYQYAIVALIISSFFLLSFWYIDHPPLYRITNPEILNVVQWIIKIAIAFSLLSISVYAHYIVTQIEKKLEEEHEKAENLLRNILPDKIADRLKDGSRSIADGFEFVSILFADLVGFTELSGNTEPARLVSLLNGIFSRFDDLVDQYGLEKIKTIGDAYMIAAGIPEPRENHGELILKCAADMITSLEAFNRENGTDLQIRIGINSGSVVAGVIGKKKFIYDLWGDSVNIASRMESHGITGKIQVSESTYRLLKGSYSFEERGEIEIKGKGKMNCYIYSG